jgi:hypothetical protein
MSEYYEYHYMTMWIEPYSHNPIIDNCVNKDKKSELKSNSIIDTYISSEPDYMYDQWKMIWID